MSGGDWQTYLASSCQYYRTDNVPSLPELFADEPRALRWRSAGPKELSESPGNCPSEMSPIEQLATHLSLFRP